MFHFIMQINANTDIFYLTSTATTTALMDTLYKAP